MTFVNLNRPTHIICERRLSNRRENRTCEYSIDNIEIGRADGLHRKHTQSPAMGIHTGV